MGYTCITILYSEWTGLIHEGQNRGTAPTQDIQSDRSPPASSLSHSTIYNWDHGEESTSDSQ